MGVSVERLLRQDFQLGGLVRNDLLELNSPLVLCALLTTGAGGSPAGSIGEFAGHSSSAAIFSKTPVLIAQMLSF